MLPKEEKQKIINNYLKEILQKSHIELYYCLTRSKCKRVFIHKSNPFVNFLYSHINNVFLIIPEKKNPEKLKIKIKKVKL